jgi:hypothetical protein
MQQPAKTKLRDYVHKRLKRKMYFYTALFVIMLLVSLYDILMQYIDTLLASIGWALGIVIGYISGRAHKVLWHPEEELVITKRDRTGIAVLIIYIMFALSRSWILGHWFTGNMLTAFIFCIVAGIRFGRILRLYRRIKKTLAQQGLR